ncbi:MAG: hypothetical protein IJP13_01065 [Lachnospiraceae bacterium]|nr:hypothetical protein [Lachnospiraceae bacterium]
MAISNVNGVTNLYESYQAQMKTNFKNNKDIHSNKNDKADKTQKADKPEKNSQIELSDAAKKLLEELKKTYGNMDFMIANYETEEEAAHYLSRGTKEYSVLIEPELLEKMAADEAVKDKYLGILDDATGKLTEMKEQLGDDADIVKRMGVSIDADGKVSYFAELEKIGERQRERIEQAKEDKAAQKKEDKKKAEEARKEKETSEISGEEKYMKRGPKKTLVQAESIEELLEMIRNTDWNKVKEDNLEQTGTRVDFSI